MPACGEDYTLRRAECPFTRLARNKPFAFGIHLNDRFSSHCRFSTQRN